MIEYRLDAKFGIFSALQTCLDGLRNVAAQSGAGAFGKPESVFRALTSKGSRAPALLRRLSCI